MQFIDLNDDRVYALQDLRRDWAQFREEDPENHAPDFKMDTSPFGRGYLSHSLSASYSRLRTASCRL